VSVFHIWHVSQPVCTKFIGLYIVYVHRLWLAGWLVRYRPVRICSCMSVPLSRTNSHRPVRSLQINHKCHERHHGQRRCCRPSWHAASLIVSFSDINYPLIYIDGCTAESWLLMETWVPSIVKMRRPVLDVALTDGEDMGCNDSPYREPSALWWDIKRLSFISNFLLFIEASIENYLPQSQSP